MKAEVKDVYDFDWSNACDEGKESFINLLLPLLDSGQEIDLYNWLKEHRLLLRSGKCPSKFCGADMIWSKARVRDKYNWKCSMKGCAGRLPIRHSSFFSNIHCEMRKALETILGWCERQSVEECASRLDLCPRVVTRIYKQCIDVAAENIAAHQEEWALGGIGGVVLVDVFPSVYMSPNYLAKQSPNEARPKRILCIADLKCLPPRVWMTLLDDKFEDLKKVKEECEEQLSEPPVKKKRISWKGGGDREEKGVGAVLAHLAQIVLPGTKVVGTSRWVPQQPLQRLTGLCGVSVESLVALDQPDTKCMLNNLRGIWRTTSEICEEAQTLPRRDARQYMLEYMWRQINGSSSSAALENILGHIASHYSDAKAAVKVETIDL
ncbi:uncharacterized protein LOC124158680 [Ischnura elegans]|uniref:uncharacterized protein LOC124158680 n=1 Tax=Ischnura elegans TaxID=197161 RepID=UPI001ED88BAC|nr:uncharacterized protein LOC124158680 [Ischnura elegans]